VASLAAASFLPRGLEGGFCGPRRRGASPARSGPAGLLPASPAMSRSDLLVAAEILVVGLHVEAAGAKRDDLRWSACILGDELRTMRSWKSLKVPQRFIDLHGQDGRRACDRMETPERTGSADGREGKFIPPRNCQSRRIAASPPVPPAAACRLACVPPGRRWMTGFSRRDQHLRRVEAERPPPRLAAGSPAVSFGMRKAHPGFSIGFSCNSASSDSITGAIGGVVAIL